MASALSQSSVTGPSSSSTGGLASNFSTRSLASAPLLLDEAEPTYYPPALTINGDGEIVIRKMLPLTFAFDHRIADGADAARFVGELVRQLSDPNLLLLET